MLCYIKRKKKAKTSSLENDQLALIDIDMDNNNDNDDDDPEITDDNNNSHSHSHSHNNDNQIVQTYNSSSSSLKHEDKTDLEDLQQKTIDISLTLSNLQRRINILEGKHDFLDLCQNDLGQRNNKIRMELYELTERERNLQNLFSYVIQNVCPKIKLNNDTVVQSANPLHLFDNSNNKKNNDFVNQLYSNIPFYYNDNHNHNEYEHLIEMIKKNGNAKGNCDAKNELRYFNQIKDFQKKYMNNLEEPHMYSGMNNDVNMGNGIVNGFNGLHDIDMNMNGLHEMGDMNDFGMNGYNGDSNLFMMSGMNNNCNMNGNCFGDEIDLSMMMMNSNNNSNLINGNIRGKSNIGNNENILKFKTTKDLD